MNSNPEVAMYLSGGAFSQHFPHPGYQDGAPSSTSSRISATSMPASTVVFAAVILFDLCIRCNLWRWGRGIPDISQARRFMFYLGSKLYSVSGTCCSTPMRLLPFPSALRPPLITQLTANVQFVAEIVSLLNNFRTSTGRSLLGFLNLHLYGQAHAGFDDIMSGTNPGCNTKCFSAVAGWDPVCCPNIFFFISTLIDIGSHT